MRSEVKSRNMFDGIIGCGMMGREHIRNINLLEKAKVTAIVEPNCKSAVKTI